MLLSKVLLASRDHGTTRTLHGVQDTNPMEVLSMKITKGVVKSLWEGVQELETELHDDAMYVTQNLDCPTSAGMRITALSARIDERKRLLNSISNAIEIDEDRRSW